ncbi:hypothetical protein GY45DRAFT_1228539, partial [Cubamyces sp. BRFM 1775]
KLCHAEHIKMALRTRFFLDGWQAYLKAADYHKSHHFIFHKAADICSILIDDLIGLIVVYHDHLRQDTPIPLLPWLHSSEVCEHVFAECHKLVKDFTYLDFIYMIPRLHVLLCSIIRFASDLKVHTSGYAYSYFNTDSINLASLVTFPSDDKIQQAACDVWQEAKSLLVLVGI